jgi:pSer/pThr/pTyr-binding forkhead associated (FHA) protein
MPTLFALTVGPDIPVESVVVIGRDPQCDVLLSSLHVSRHHCILREEGGDIMLRDLGSANGTWVNGRRVSRARLVPGDEIAIAHLRYQFRDPSAPVASADRLTACLGIEL